MTRAGWGRHFTRGAQQERRPREPLGHLSRLGFALRSAPDVDHIAAFLMGDLVELPEVTRVGMALTEGGGRRLRFVANERVSPDGLDVVPHRRYDDVPMTAVVRTGEPILGNLDELERAVPRGSSPSSARRGCRRSRRGRCPAPARRSAG